MPCSSCSSSSPCTLHHRNFIFPLVNFNVISRRIRDIVHLNIRFRDKTTSLRKLYGALHPHTPEVEKIGMPCMSDPLTDRGQRSITAHVTARTLRPIGEI